MTRHGYVSDRSLRGKRARERSVYADIRAPTAVTTRLRRVCHTPFTVGNLLARSDVLETCAETYSM